jgi:hypothetical protein
VLCLHEYWDHRGPEFNWGWWAGRYEQCPWDVPIVIGECGLDEAVADGNVAAHMRGWQGWMGAGEYAVQVAEYVERCAADRRVVGCCLFTTDFGDPWQSFDTLPAHGVLSVIHVEARGPVQPAPPVVPPSSSVLVHPLPGATISQNIYANEEYYRQALGIEGGHNGTDFAAATGTPVLSLAAGVVAWSDVDKDYGEYIRVTHDQLQACSFYAHLSERLVAHGEAVKAGQVVGLVGSTGLSSGSHLHLEVRLLNQDGSYMAGTPHPKGRVDPRSWAGERGLRL